MDDPEAFRLHCPDLPLEQRTLWEVNYTTGSTSDPTPLYVTTHDYVAYLGLAKRVGEISGIREDDVLMNLFPLTPAPMGAFMRSPMNATRPRRSRRPLWARRSVISCIVRSTKPST